MIFIYHNQKKVLEIERHNKYLTFNSGFSVSKILKNLAKDFPDEILVWCELNFKTSLNKNSLESLLHHQKMMLSFSPNGNFFGNNIGFIEDSPVINVNKKVRYPTWQMSSCVGMIHSKVVFKMDAIACYNDFDYYLNSLAKIGLPLGLICYSEPQLLINHDDKSNKSASDFQLFKFVKQHYKMQWTFLLLLNLMVYKSKMPILAFLYAAFFKNRKENIIQLDSIDVQSSRLVVNDATLDVIIPTIGRKKYLHDVLKDLAAQTHLPINVIIVEQNSEKDSVSDLDFLYTEKWPFIIDHTFTHQAGACNARNIALSKVKSEWVFMADDDIRFNEKFIEMTLKKAKQYGAKSVTTLCLNRNQINYYLNIHQSGIFGSGCSFIKSELTNLVSFDKSLEFGYGEDTDFGLQLRNLGEDIIYFPELEILHLSASMGGFRIKPAFPWTNNKLQPKPSPTIMYLKLKHNTFEQICGYKLVLFIRLINKQSIFEYYKFFKSFQQKWNCSVYWANELKQND